MSWQIVVPRGYTHEDYQDAKYLQHQPPVARNASIILEQLPLCASDVGRNVQRVGVDPLDSFSLFGDHICELREYLAQLSNS